MQQQQILEQQKQTIRDAVQRVFKGFIIKKDFSNEEYEIMDAITRKSCLQFKFVALELVPVQLVPLQLVPVQQKHYPALPHNPKYKDLTVLHISSLSKCGANSGNMLLRLVDELAKSIPFVEHITLMDASNIKKCNKRINLADLRILTSETGESWYNHWGYKSVKHAENMNINSEIRNENMKNFLDINPLLKSNVMRVFPELDTNDTVHKYVKTIYDQIRSFPEEDECDDEQIEKIQTLQMLIDKLSVEYFKGLIKTVEHGLHGGSKRSATKRSAKKQSEKKRKTNKSRRR
ncbi:MAG: hypothetical protein FJX80_07635 [Bacteroidetes bacterium]|nr:hypothetical protein [Bacteroidota bacterium]